MPSARDRKNSSFVVVLSLETVDNVEFPMRIVVERILLESLKAYIRS
jgi:hypothetical protein